MTEQIRMLHKARGHTDSRGVFAAWYYPGKVYRVVDADMVRDGEVLTKTAKAFLGEKLAEMVGAKNMGASPENKMMPVPQNKATGNCPKCGKYYKKGLHLHARACKGSASK